MRDHEALALALMTAVVEAGAVLLEHRAAGVAVETKADKSPVTAADRAAEAVVLAALATVAAGVPVIAEEEVAAGRVPAHEGTAFLVDALDGTREFVRGGDDFTVNIGLVEAGVPTFGLLLAPAAGRLFATFGASKAVAARIEPPALRRDAAPAIARGLAFSPITTAEPGSQGLRVLASRSHRSPATDAFLARIRVAAINPIGSSLKLGLMAAGEADVYPRLGPTSAWDIAAGHAVLAAAGGAVTTLDGAPLRYLGRGASFENPSFVAWGKPRLVTPYIPS